MSDLNKCSDLTLELFSEISLACVLTMVSKLELLDCDVIFFVSCFEDVCASTGADLLL